MSFITVKFGGKFVGDGLRTGLIFQAFSVRIYLNSLCSHRRQRRGIV